MNNIKSVPLKLLVFSFFFLAGFARLPHTKIGGIQLFVIVAIIIIVYLFISSNKKLTLYNEKGDQSYLYFLIASLPALFISLLYENYNSIYFFTYTVIPYFLYVLSKRLSLNYITLLRYTELSLLIVILIGWTIYFKFLPFDYIFHDAVFSEFNLGYWGISYLESSRNHDYMYPLICDTIALFFYLNTSNKFEKKIQLVIFLLCEITLLASLSRGAMIISAFLFFLFLKEQKKHTRIKIVCLSIFLLLILGSRLESLEISTYSDIFLSIFGIVKETSEGSSFSNDSRSVIYLNALAHAWNPFGYGISNYVVITTYNGGSAENAYLTLLIERGWFALAMFLSFLFRKFRVCTRTVGKLGLNYYLVPCVLIYFLFNYEFTSFMCVYVFYLILNSIRWIEKI